MRRVVKFDTSAGTPVGGSLTEGSLARYAFGVSELLPGRVIEFEALVRATATVGTDTLLMRVRFGTSATPSANTAVAAGTATDVANNDVVQVRGKIHIQSATRYVFHIWMDNPPGATGTAAPKSYYNAFTAVADTAYYLDVTATWSTVNANSAQSECWAVYEDQV